MAISKFFNPQKTNAFLKITYVTIPTLMSKHLNRTQEQKHPD